MVSERNGFPSPLGNHTGTRASNSRSKGKNGSKPPRVGEKIHDLSLVEQDGLFFRVIPGVQDTLAHQDFDPAVIAESFREAFNSVWERLSPADQRRLLNYWQRG